MSLDTIIGSKKILKFSPIINIDDFRYNAIYTKNLIKMAFPCEQEDILQSLEENRRKRKLLEEEGGSETSESDIDDDSRRELSDRESRSQSLASSVYREGTDIRSVQKASNQLFQFMDMKAPPGETETKYKERLNHKMLRTKYSPYNKPVIDGKKMEKYRNGFLNYINQMGGNIEEANKCTNDVKTYGKECIKRSPQYTTGNLFGGFYKNSCDLASHIMNKKRRQIFFNDNILKGVYLRKLKYFYMENYALDTRTNELTDGIPDEVRVTVRMYRPKVRKDERLSYNGDERCPPIDKVFYFCGANTLKQLRNNIICQWDVTCLKSEDKGPPNYTDFMLFHVPSSFIFIHDTLYIDTSNSDLKDITEEYRKFINDRPWYGPVKVAKMEETKIRDLNLRLGMAYVFVHMGGRCEHMFSISDLRMLSYNDYHNLNIYPIRVSSTRMNIKKCFACKVRAPRYVIVECSLLIKCPRLMCSDCYKKFYYTMNIKNSDSIAYPFINRYYVA
uniref:snRNA-activating protein complex subunit 3 n=1 Tax=Parastrongyloides trichosuri TaxID=131310 RepID=A0A0N4ZYW7_PARTI